MSSDKKLQEEFPLHRAVCDGDLDHVRRLISAGVSVNKATMADNSTPLHEACLYGNPACISPLLQAGAVVNSRNVDGATPLCHAAHTGDVTCVMLLLREGALLNPTMGASTPLHEAVLADNVEVINTLIEAGADLNASDLHHGTALHAAAYKNHVNSAAALLRAGAQVNALKTHQTALHNAASCRRRNTAMVALLLEHGADLHVRNGRGLTARHLAEWSDEVTSLLTYWEMNVPRLVQLCRLAVRRTIGPARLRDVTKLGLPTPATDFLQYTEWRPQPEAWPTNATTHT